MVKKPITTKHSQKRTKERLGLSKKLTDKQAEKALLYGVSHAETKGNLKKYMDGIFLRHKTSNNTKIFNRKVYIFNDNILITVMNLPNNLSGAADTLQKKKMDQKEN